MIILHILQIRQWKFFHITSAVCRWTLGTKPVCLIASHFRLGERVATLLVLFAQASFLSATLSLSLLFWGCINPAPLYAGFWLGFASEEH